MANKSSVVKDIYNYNDVKVFLRDFFEERKECDHKFSKQFFATKAGFSNHSILSLFVSGKRNITENSKQKLQKIFDFTPHEKEYFFVLVDFSQSEDVEEREQNFRKLNIIRQKINLSGVSVVQYKFFENWYTAVIKEIVTSEFWDKDVEKLNTLLRPQISSVEAKKSFQLLLDLNMISLKDGKYISNDKIIYASAIEAYTLNKARKNMIEISKNIGETMTKDERFIYSATLSLSKENIEKIDEYLENFKKKFEELMMTQDDEKIDVVQQLNIQFFPLTTLANKWGNNEK